MVYSDVTPSDGVGGWTVYVDIVLRLSLQDTLSDT